MNSSAKCKGDKLNMSMNNITLNAEMVFPPHGAAILVDVKPNTIFTNGKPTGEDGIKVTVAALPTLDKITVKIPNVTTPITSEQLAEMNLAGRFVWVEFIGFEGKIYQNFSTKEVGISAKATGINILESKIK